VRPYGQLTVRKWQYAGKACSCSSKREKAKPSASLYNNVECAAVVSKDSSAILRVAG